MEEAFLLFDNYNKQDPNTVSWEGVTYPAEFFYALQLHNWVKKLQPNASEALLLASRCQHIGRWKIARNNYPMNKAGYYKWRTELAKFHADTATDFLLQAGYDDATIKQVAKILLKQQLKTDPDVQTMEDALCLVFLQYQYNDFIAKHEDEKVIRILQKSWNKMNKAGRDAAVTLPMTGRGQALLAKALA